MATAPQQMTAQQMQQLAVQTNMAARQAVVKQAVDMTQQIFTQSYSSGPGTVINLPPRNVGLIKRFWVEVVATVTGTSGGPTHTLSTLGPSNFFSQIVFTDLSNQTRIQSPGWLLNQVSSAKRRRPFGAAMTTDSPLGYGNNYTTVMAAPSTISTSITSSNVFAMFEVPLSYTDHDLRGAIYANVVNATMQLQLTVNANLFVASGTDATLAMYQSSSATVASCPTFTVTVFQNYLDQLPISQGANGAAGGPILPLLDLSTVYLVQNTTVSGLVANQDIPIPYANFRDFMSTTIIYDNAGTLNTGTDIAYWAIQSANYTNILKYDYRMAALLSRLILEDDVPKGMTYFDHRNKPISTIQYGNMSLIANVSTVSSSTSSFLVGYEMLALQNMITQAGSLYGT